MTRPPRNTIADSHRAREIAESFGADAAHYDRARPGYPRELVDRILGTAREADVLDVGIGTGHSAVGFRDAGARVTGVEVDARMAEFARSRGFDVEVAKFEDWSAGGRRFDLVVAGQTWHWIDPLAGATKAADVLREGGRLAAFWNSFRFPAELDEAFRAVNERVLPDGPFRVMFVGPEAYAGLLDKAADGIRTSGRFAEPERFQVDWTRTYTRDEWLDFVPTAGGVNRLPTDTLDELLAGIGAAVDDHGGTFDLDYAALALTATRL